MNKNSFLKLTLLLSAFIVVFFASCDNEFNELGSDIVGIDNYNFFTKECTVTTENIDLGVVETTDLPINPLGFYDNPVYGKTTANFATQIQLAAINPTLNPALQPWIQSVILTVPYKYIKGTTDSAGATAYVLDSIYGPDPATTKMKLSIYESGYFLTNIGSDQTAQSYYSNQNQDFDNAKIGTPLNNDTEVTQNEQFFFDKTEHVVVAKTLESGKTDSTTVTARTVPGMRLRLSKDFFKTKIFQAPAGKLINNNVFKDYFRGLYFKVEQVGSNAGNLAMLNFGAGTITITYREYVSVPEENPGPDYVYPARVTKKLVLNLTGKTVSLVNQTPRVVAPNPQKLFLKGGADNSMAVIDLFAGNEKEDLKNGNLLINDAILTFNIDRSAMDVGAVRADEPLRLYLYDFNNKRPIADYRLDYSTSTKSTKLNKSLYGGVIKKDSDGRGTQYKFRLTKHMIQMIKLDSTNVRLGLVVTEDINEVTPANKKVKVPQMAGKLKVIPTMSTVHPLGTVLYGSNIPAGDPNYDKRPKLEIYYTKPKQN